MSIRERCEDVQDSKTNEGEGEERVVKEQRAHSHQEGKGREREEEKEKRRSRPERKRSVTARRDRGYMALWRTWSGRNRKRKLFRLVRLSNLEVRQLLLYRSVSRDGRDGGMRRGGGRHGTRGRSRRIGRGGGGRGVGRFRHRFGPDPASQRLGALVSVFRQASEGEERRHKREDKRKSVKSIVGKHRTKRE
jgi:hypothetical protein